MLTTAPPSGVPAPAGPLPELKPVEIVLLGLLRFELASSVAEVALKLRLSEVEVQGMLDGFERMGLVERFHCGRSGAAKRRHRPAR